MFGKLRLIAGVVVLTIPLAHASESTVERPRTEARAAEHATAEVPDASAEGVAAEPTLLRPELAAIFPDLSHGAVVQTTDGLIASGGATEVVIARIGPDGKVVLGCVDTETAARRFFDAPADRLPVARGQEK